MAEQESVWAANGTAALHLALEAVGCTGKRVAVQPNVCPNVVAAILTSGNRPLFVDIERTRLGLDPLRLADAIGSAGAVVAVHAYGIACRIEEIAQLAARRCIPLIEDCAQAEGATADGTPVGSFGDVAVYSYGAGKILAAGGGGRAVARQSETAGRLKALADALPAASDSDAAGQLSSVFRDLYNAAYPDALGPQREGFAVALRELGASLLAKPGGATIGRCEARQRELPGVIESRRRKAALYAELLAGIRDLEPLPFPQGSVPWRFNAWIEPRRRMPLFRALLARHVPSSTWYPEISRFLPPGSYEGAPCPNASWLDQGVLNLWLDEATSEAGVREAAGQVAGLMRQSVPA